MEANTDAGGCCSEVVIDVNLPAAKASWEAMFLNYMQYYEYKYTICLFKAFEGWASYTMSLPGCYCMYRLDAIKGFPLNTLFKLIT